MAWQQIGPRRYYYRNQRVAGRSVRRYVGTGLVADLAAAADDLRKLKRVIAAREQKAEQARQHQAEAPLLALCRLTDLLTHATLVTEGYRQHDRGEWRRHRGTQRVP
jgi:hypothetical protein